MEKIELWGGVRGRDFSDTHCVRFVGEFLAVVDVARGDDWVERCVLYRTDDGCVVVHQMRLSICGDGVDVAEVYVNPPLDAVAEEHKRLSQHSIEIKEKPVL